MTCREGSTDYGWGDRLCLFTQTSGPSWGFWRSFRWSSVGIYRTGTYGSQRRQEGDFRRRKGNEVYSRKVFVLWWVKPPGCGMCGKEKGSEVQGGWSKGKRRRAQDRFRGIRKRPSQLKEDGSSVDTKSCVLNALKCFGISRLSVSKVEVLEGSLEGRHLVITSTLTVNNHAIPTHALMDCGATGIAFLNRDSARHHQISLQELKQIRQVEVIDRRPIESGDITHVAKVGMMMKDQDKQLPMFVTKLGHYPIVPGIPGLRLHDVAVQFASNIVSLGSQYCTTHCHDAPVTVQGVTEEPPEPVYAPGGIFEPQIRPQWHFWGNIVMLNGSSFFSTVMKGKLKVFKASLYDIKKAMEPKVLKERPLEGIVPIQYHEFLPLFNKVLADRRPPHRPGVDRDVRLTEGEIPTWGPLYSMSRAELVVLKQWLEENMSIGLIHQSLWPFAAPVLFAKEPDGGQRFCILYRDINGKAIKNW